MPIYEVRHNNLSKMLFYDLMYMYDSRFKADMLLTLFTLIVYSNLSEFLVLYYVTPAQLVFVPSLSKPLNKKNIILPNKCLALLYFTITNYDKKL